MPPDFGRQSSGWLSKMHLSATTKVPTNSLLNRYAHKARHEDLAKILVSSINSSWHKQRTMQIGADDALPPLALSSRSGSPDCSAALGHHLFNALHRQQLRAGSWMARLAAALAVTAFAPLGPLKIWAVAGGRFGGVARAADDPLPQAGHDNQTGLGIPTTRTSISSSLCLR